MKIEGMKLVREGDKKPSDILNEMILAEGKKVKLTIPFKADGFESTKMPTQPDGITPVVVEKANLIDVVVKKSVEVKPIAKPLIKPKETKFKKKKKK